MINILIADDHPLVREGLKKTLRSESDLNVICEASDGQGVLAQVEGNELDVIVMDISMPGMSGLDVLKELKLKYPKLPVIILSMHPEERFGIRAIKAGAASYLTKESVPEELIKAIRKVVKGGKYITPFLAEKLADEIESKGDEHLDKTLSDREFQIICLLASGKSTKEIAAELFLSINTVCTYRARILEKLNLKTNVELTHYAIQNRLID
jgi:two-component system, NarL family, invasion response regulator UvrY